MHRGEERIRACAAIASHAAIVSESALPSLAASMARIASHACSEASARVRTIRTFSASGTDGSFKRFTSWLLYPGGRETKGMSTMCTTRSSHAKMAACLGSAGSHRETTVWGQWRPPA
jgi:hypothetical protein